MWRWVRIEHRYLRPAHTYAVCALVRRFSSCGRSFPSHESPNYSLSSDQDPVDPPGVDYTCQGTPWSLGSSCYSYGLRVPSPVLLKTCYYMQASSYISMCNKKAFEICTRNPLTCFTIIKPMHIRTCASIVFRDPSRASGRPRHLEPDTWEECCIIE